MGLSLSSTTLDLIGIIFSAVGVAIAFGQAFATRVHSRALDYLQWGYILALANSSFSGIFSQYLYVASSYINLSTETLSGFYCPMGTYVCATAFALSFLCILVGVLIVLRLVTISEKVNEKGLTFPRIYAFFKGLFRWFYLPLIYISIRTLLATTDTISIPAIVVLAVLVAFPIVQVLVIKKYESETDDPFVKWIEFASYLKAGLFAILVALSQTYSATSFTYYIAVVIVAYAGLFATKHDFSYEVLGRVLYITGEVVFYFLYSLYVSGSSWLATYCIDLFALGLILGIDLVGLVLEGVARYRSFKGSAEILPEESNDMVKKGAYEV